MRYLVAILCGLIILVRAFVPGFNFDQTSFSLLLVAALVLLLPELKPVASVLKRIKKGEWEIEFQDTLEALARRTDQAEERLEKSEAEIAAEETIPADVEKTIIEASQDPRAAIMLLGVKIEKRLRELAVQAAISEGNRPVSIRLLLKRLQEHGLLDKDLEGLFSHFWTVRNEVVHGRHFDVRPNQLFEFVALGNRLLRFLYVKYPKKEPPA